MKTKEMRVYIIDPDQITEDKGSYPNRDNDVSPRQWSNGEFMEEAETQGWVYSLPEFQSDFNDDMINPNTFIRFIEVEY